MPYNGSPFGLLYNDDLKILRKHFKDATVLCGMPGVKYYEPLPNKTFNKRNDLEANYAKPVDIGCFFHEHPDQKTVKAIGWAAELQEGSSLIEVPFDTPNLQVGALFSVPSGIDGAVNRLFRVITMSNIMLSPVSYTCELALEFEDLDEQVNVTDFSKDDFTLLIDNEEDD